MPGKQTKPDTQAAKNTDAGQWFRRGLNPSQEGSGGKVAGHGATLGATLVAEKLLEGCKQAWPEFVHSLPVDVAKPNAPKFFAQWGVTPENQADVAACLRDMIGQGA